MEINDKNNTNYILDSWIKFDDMEKIFVSVLLPNIEKIK